MLTAERKKEIEDAVESIMRNSLCSPITKIDAGFLHSGGRLECMWLAEVAPGEVLRTYITYVGPDAWLMVSLASFEPTCLAPELSVKMKFLGKINMPASGEVDTPLLKALFSNYQKFGG